MPSSKSRKRKLPPETPPANLSELMSYLGSRGGKAGTGKAKARDPEKMRAAARKYWDTKKSGKS